MYLCLPYNDNLYAQDPNAYDINENKYLDSLQDYG
jgi:hypothetical protein